MCLSWNGYGIWMFPSSQDCWVKQPLFFSEWYMPILVCYCCSVTISFIACILWVTSFCQGGVGLKVATVFLSLIASKQHFLTLWPCGRSTKRDGKILGKWGSKFSEKKKQQAWWWIASKNVLRICASWQASFAWISLSHPLSQTLFQSLFLRCHVH